MSAFLIHVAILACIFILLVTSLNIAIGYTGLINLGHIAFFGVGAYVSAILTTRYDMSFVFAFFCAGVVAALVGGLLTRITAKLTGDYFALATLGFAFVAFSFFLNLRHITRGPLGIAGISRPELFGMSIQSNEAYLVFALCITAVVVLLLWRIVSSRFGRLLEAVRDDALGVAALGKNPMKLTYQAMCISAFCAGIAGSLFAHFISFIDPTSFFLRDIVVILTMVVVGGLASLRGSVVGAVLLLFLGEAVRFVAIPSAYVGPLREMIFATLLLAILLVRPRGLFGKIDLQ